ncbi:hypothetical protein LJC49_10215 [Ruminococcaceae bacterium OttesenSCG-928-I18]|nr:hypothetical protein [Ruminococcaceae bacterium OttesenSCG-928-I18]
MDIVKVQYRSQKTMLYSAREYSYFSAIPLKVGDEIMVPVRDSMGAAVVSKVGVPEAEVADFADKMKIIAERIPAEPVAAPVADPLAE